MNLIIDEGNTRVKLAVFENDELIDFKFSTENCFKKSVLLLLEKYIIKATILSSVTYKVIETFKELKILKKYILTEDTLLPFENLYKTPSTLGVDRLALTMAAYQKYQKKNTLIIDAGTCITYDFINNKGIYLGGAISPGIQMRLDGMSHFTQKLPRLTLKDSFSELIGTSTKESIWSGVFNGTVFEIKGTIREYQHRFEKVQIVLTGGDANSLYKPLKNSIFVSPNFLLEGLNEVLKYQDKI